jgi:DNA repair exonuclease SbcCD ATPase subunit
MNLVQELAEARNSIETLTATNKELTTQVAGLTNAAVSAKATADQALAAEQNAHKATQETLTKAQTDLTAAQAEVKTVKAEVKTANEKIEAFDKTLEEKASKRALEIVAAGGAGAIENKPKEQPASQENKSELKGFAKVRAAFAKQVK